MMNLNTLRNYSPAPIYRHRPPPPNSWTSSLTSFGNYKNENNTADVYKPQSWRDFMHEQSAKSSRANSIIVTDEEMPHRPSSAISCDSVSTSSVNGRSHSSNARWQPRYNNNRRFRNDNEHQPVLRPSRKRKRHEQSAKSSGANSIIVTDEEMPDRPSSAISCDSVSTSSVNGRSHSSNARWQPRYNNNRRFRNDNEHQPVLRPSRKRKRPFPQNVPSRKEWTTEDAERALLIERECIKRRKTSLLIKFPDLEVNRNIVLKYHSEIERVYFQQPSTPRFCFVTLKDASKADEVIQNLKKIKFGNSFLSVDYRIDKHDEQIVSAKDIDPYTLYVGNLAQEITRDEMQRLYQGCRRIDIGYAKKMKYTRYAFVTFHTVQAAIDAFKRTHNHQIYNKSLIVRFRRFHGSDGMPGGSNSPNIPSVSVAPDETCINITETDEINETIAPSEIISERADTKIANERPVIPFMIDIKQETEIDYDDEDECNVEDQSIIGHVPKTVKIEVKTEVKPEAYLYGSDNRVPDTKVRVKSEVKREIKTREPHIYDEDDSIDNNDYQDSEMDHGSGFYSFNTGFGDLLNQVVERDRVAQELQPPEDFDNM